MGKQEYGGLYDGMMERYEAGKAQGLGDDDAAQKVRRAAFRKTIRY
jgi:hypothetical protein